MSGQLFRAHAGCVPQSDLPPQARPSQHGRAPGNYNLSGGSSRTKKACQDIRQEAEQLDRPLGYIRNALTVRWPISSVRSANMSGVNCLTVLLRLLVVHFPTNEITVAATAATEQNCPWLRHAFLTFGPPSLQDHETAFDELARAVWSQGSFADVPKEELSFLNLLQRQDLLQHVWPYFDMNMYQDVLHAENGSRSIISHQLNPESRTANTSRFMASGWPGNNTLKLSGVVKLTDRLYPKFSSVSSGHGDILLPMPNYWAVYGHLTIIIGRIAPTFEDLRVYYNYKRRAVQTRESGLEWQAFDRPGRYALIAMVKCGTNGAPDCIRVWHSEGMPVEPLGHRDLSPYYDNTWKCEELEEGTKLFCLYVRSAFEGEEGAISETVDETKRKKRLDTSRRIMPQIEDLRNAFPPQVQR